MKEICVIQADLQALAGQPARGTGWWVVREDDEAFAELSAPHPERVRDVQDVRQYQDTDSAWEGTRYNYTGAVSRPAPGVAPILKSA